MSLGSWLVLVSDSPWPAAPRSAATRAPVCGWAARNSTPSLLPSQAASRACRAAARGSQSEAVGWVRSRQSTSTSPPVAARVKYPAAGGGSAAGA